MPNIFTKPVIPTVLLTIGIVSIAVAAYIVWSMATAEIETPQIYNYTSAEVR